MKVTKERAQNILNLINAGAIEQQKDKLSYAVNRFAAINKQAFQAIDEELQDARIKHASVDKEGNLITSEKGAFSFTKEAMKELKSAIEEIYSQEVELNPFICEDLTRVKKLDPFLIETFDGLLFNYSVEDYFSK